MKRSKLRTGVGAIALAVCAAATADDCVQYVDNRSGQEFGFRAYWEDRPIDLHYLDANGREVEVCRANDYKPGGCLLLPTRRAAWFTPRNSTGKLVVWWPTLPGREVQKVGEWGWTSVGPGCVQIIHQGRTGFVILNEPRAGDVFLSKP